jgi:hypothetical protein
MQILGWTAAIAGLSNRFPVMHRIAAPASAMLLLNAAAVVGLYKFLMTRGPLWKIWNSTETAAVDFDAESEDSTPPESATIVPGVDIGRELCNDSKR